MFAIVVDVARRKDFRHWGKISVASSSSTIEVFGEPRAIWREDSATRKEPLVRKGKKGKKRKSHEFESDMLETASRLSQDSFVAIDSFLDEPRASESIDDILKVSTSQQQRLSPSRMEKEESLSTSLSPQLAAELSPRELGRLRSQLGIKIADSCYCFMCMFGTLWRWVEVCGSWW